MEQLLVTLQTIVNELEAIEVGIITEPVAADLKPNDNILSEAARMRLVRLRLALEAGIAKGKR